VFFLASYIHGFCSILFHACVDRLPNDDTEVEVASQAFLNEHQLGFMAPYRARTYYGVLEVGRQAQSGEINTAYRKLALRRHPDKNLGNSNAVAEMQEVSSASLLWEYLD